MEKSQKTTKPRWKLKKRSLYRTVWECQFCGGVCIVEEDGDHTERELPDCPLCVEMEE